MLKKLLLSFFVSLCLVALSGNATKAKVPKTTSKGIKINKTNFPKKKVRDKVKRKFDLNKDGYLSKKETPRKKQLSFTNGFKRIGYNDDGADVLSEVKMAKDESHKYEEYFNVKKITFFTVKLETFDPSAFPYLEELKIMYCENVGKLDFSKNVRLKSILIYGCDVSELNLNKNKNVNKVEILGSPIKELKLDRCKELKSLTLEDNGNLNQIDVSKNSNLEQLKVHDNKLNEVVLGKNKKLRTLDLSDNPITRIDLNGLSELRSLDLSATTISSLNPVNNKKLEYLNLSLTQITNVDFIKQLLNLKMIHMKGCAITKLDVSNLKKLSTINVDGNVEVIR